MTCGVEHDAQRFLVPVGGLVRRDGSSCGDHGGHGRFDVVDEELEAVWGGKKTALDALNTAVLRGNELINK